MRNPNSESPSKVVWLRQPDQCGGSAPDVERINPFSFYEFGKTLRALEAFKGDIATTMAFWPAWQAQDSLTKLIKGEPIPIGISAAKARSVLERVQNLMKNHYSMKGEDGNETLRFPVESDKPIPAWTFEWIKAGLTEFETVFAEEMRETATYFVPRRGIYYTPALVDNAEQTFPQNLMPFIPDKAKTDFAAAGRCLAFNLLSASGFHVARAVEGCLEAYYGLFSGKPGETLNNWHDYIQALQKIADKKPEPCPSAKTLAELDQMRTDYRNPIVHPRVVLNEGDARMLFANGESLIIAMAQEIAEAKEKGVQLTLIGGSDTETPEAPKQIEAAKNG